MISDLNNEQNAILNHDDRIIRKLASFVYKWLYANAIRKPEKIRINLRTITDEDLAALLIARRLAYYSNLDINGTCWAFAYDTIMIPPSLNQGGCIGVSLDALKYRLNAGSVEETMISDINRYIAGKENSEQKEPGRLISMTFEARVCGSGRTRLIVTDQHCYNLSMREEEVVALITREEYISGIPSRTLTETEISGIYLGAMRQRID